MPIQLTQEKEAALRKELDAAIRAVLEKNLGHLHIQTHSAIIQHSLLQPEGAELKLHWHFNYFHKKDPA